METKATESHGPHGICAMYGIPGLCRFHKFRRMLGFHGSDRFHGFYRTMDSMNAFHGFDGERWIQNAYVFHGSHGSGKLYRFHGFFGIPNNLNYICRYPNDIWRYPNDTSDIRTISGDTPTIFKYIRRHSDATEKIHSWINSYNKPSVSAVQEPCRNRE